MNKNTKQIQEILDALFPDPKIPLKFTDPYTLLIATLLEDIADLRAALALPNALLPFVTKAETVFIERADRHFDNLAAVGRQDTLLGDDIREIFAHGLLDLLIMP